MGNLLRKRTDTLPGKLLRKLADPLDGSALTLLNDKLFSSQGREYSIRNGIPDLFPDAEMVARYIGSRNLAAWVELQRRAETSYAIRTEGHFSTKKVPAALEYGAFIAKLPAGEVLDLGCGKLSRPAYMMGAKHRFFGIDPIAFEADRAFHFVRGYADFLPFKPAVFDHAIFASSLDHAINPMRALEEAVRVVRPGGTISAWVKTRAPDETFKRWADRARYFTMPFNEHHNWAFTRDSLGPLLEAAGLKNVGLRPIPAKNQFIVSGVRPS